MKLLSPHLISHLHSWSLALPLKPPSTEHENETAKKERTTKQFEKTKNIERESKKKIISDQEKSKNGGKARRRTTGKARAEQSQEEVSE